MRALEQGSGLLNPQGGLERCRGESFAYPHDHQFLAGSYPYLEDRATCLRLSCSTVQCSGFDSISRATSIRDLCFFSELSQLIMNKACWKHEVGYSSLTSNLQVVSYTKRLFNNGSTTSPSSDCTMRNHKRQQPPTTPQKRPSPVGTMRDYTSLERSHLKTIR